MRLLKPAPFGAARAHRVDGPDARAKLSKFWVLLVLDEDVGGAVDVVLVVVVWVVVVELDVDVLVCSAQDVKEWAHLPGTVLYWALREGRVVHG